MFAPLIQSARPRRRYKYDRFDIAFLEEIVTLGLTEYEFIFAVFEEGATTPFLFVTSERKIASGDDTDWEDLGLSEDDFPLEEGGSHFLCIFDTGAHYNYGDSNDWADANKFEAAALEILADRLGGIPFAVS